MQFTETPLKGAYLITLEPKRDERGYFARTFCKDEFAKLGLATDLVQCSTSYNCDRGIIRGMHYQAAPYSETKLVRCIRGAIHDVIIDIREESDTYMQCFGVELSDSNLQMLYIPKGFAHGYKTLEANTEIFYMMDEFYHPDAALSLSTELVTTDWK